MSTTRGGLFSPASRHERSSLSVVVHPAPRVQPLSECLDSLAAQTLSHRRFEVVVLNVGAERSTIELVSAIRKRSPSLRLRVLSVGEAGASFAPTVGLSASVGDYVTFVDGAERLPPGYLEAMLGVASPDHMVVATFDDPALQPLAGRSVAPETVVSVFDNLHGKLVLAEAARAAGSSVAPTSWSLEAAVPSYWLAIYEQHPYRVRVLDHISDATYERRDGDGWAANVTYDGAVTRSLLCLDALARIPRVGGDVSLLRRAIGNQQARHINAYLRQHPHDQSRVHIDARTLGLHDIPWSLVNEGLARDLAVTYCFAPSLDTSGLVAAKRLGERGLVTDVVSHDLSSERDIDPDSLKLADAFLGRHHVIEGRAQFADWAHISSFVARVVDIVQAWETESGPYRSLYTRAMAPASHFAGALLKLRRPELPWIAEFSDPLKINPVGIERSGDVLPDWLSRELAAGMEASGYEVRDEQGGLRIFDWAERLPYALADGLMFTNSSQLDIMTGYCADPKLVNRVHERAEVRHHPTPPRHFYDLVPTPLDRSDDVINLGYFGVFYSTRDLGDVVRALSCLRQKERELVRMHVFTRDPHKLALEIVREGLAGTVQARPYVPIFEFLNLSTQFDVLVVNDAHTAAHFVKNPYLPAKVADYLGSGTPIWAICEPGSIMSGMRFAHSTQIADVGSAVEVLRTLIRAKQAQAVSSGR